MPCGTVRRPQPSRLTYRTGWYAPRVGVVVRLGRFYPRHGATGNRIRDPPEFIDRSLARHLIALRSRFVTITAPARDQPLAVMCNGVTYPAEAIAKGAAYEIFSTSVRDGFVPNPRPGTLLPYRRFVHATEVEVVAG